MPLGSNNPTTLDGSLLVLFEGSEEVRNLLSSNVQPCLLLAGFLDLGPGQRATAVLVQLLEGLPQHELPEKKNGREVVLGTVSLPERENGP